MQDLRTENNKTLPREMKDDLSGHIRHDCGSKGATLVEENIEEIVVTLSLAKMPQTDFKKIHIPKEKSDFIKFINFYF